ncbi:ABC transporter substrate-binding protein/permease [Fluviispira multicolorata]|uniref:ABC transporter permease subunit n=1 Tax=Fluviispira multicolorata TaxID=2654512 RepID=A0A833JFP5_9BACT|nr:ABC transporter substrate-binding protein/permease [Fluviispira multicolorata]KAB8033440.1 ABC transporter permease subunit [Fluviispira multicolorata]
MKKGDHTPMLNMRNIIVTLSCIFFSIHAFCSEKGILRWGSDANSGAPYVFRDAKDPSKIIGLDVDIIEAVAEKLNMKPVFIQNQWDGLIPGLNAGNYDVVIDGLEIIDEREQAIRFSDPYYITYEQLVVNKENHEINELKDLKGKRVATLPASLAYKILEDTGDVQIKKYGEEINAYADLASGERLDAVLLDAPIAQYYAKHNAKLKFVGPNIGYMKYGIAFKQDNNALRIKVNKALNILIKEGKIQTIIEKWGLWNPKMAEAWGVSVEPKTEAVGYKEYLRSMNLERTFIDKLKLYVDFFPLLAKGAVRTLEISMLAMVVAVVFGLFIALIRLYAHPVLSKLALTYVEIIRGTPLLIQLYLIFYGLPNLGIKFEPYVAAVIGLGMNYAASEAENYRAGISSIPHSQMDAAFALGMSRLEALRHIVIPQAMRVVIPPVTNDFIALIKDSSLVSVITLIELTTVYGQLASTYFDYLGIGLLTAAMYFLIGLPFARLSRMAEKYYSVNNKKQLKGVQS